MQKHSPPVVSFGIGENMSLAFLGDLMIVSVINFIVVTGITFGVLYTIDKINDKKDEE